MANRAPIDFNLGTARIQPVASPVDTYARPQASGLSQLAESLKSVAPEVAKYSDVVAQQQSEAQKAAGEKKARELFDSGTSYRDAIKKGLISPSESPWFQLGAKEQYGRVTAGKYSSDLAFAVANDPGLQTSTDVTEYDKFAGDFKKQWTADNVGTSSGLNFDHGFGSMAEAYGADERSKFVAEAGTRLVKQTSDNVYAEGFTTLKHELSMNTSHDAIAAGLGIVLQRATAMGVNERTANMAIVKAIGDMVQQKGDVSLFDIMKKIPAGNQSLDARPWAQEEIQKVTHQVYSDQQDHARNDREVQDAARVEDIRQRSSDLSIQLANSANPSRENIQVKLDALMALSSSAGQEIVRFKDAMIGAHFESNTPMVHSTMADIFNPSANVDVHTLVGLVGAHQINQADFSYLHGLIDQRDEAARREANAPNEHNPFSDPQFTHAMSAIKPLIGNEFDPALTPETAARIHGAVAELGTRWLEYTNGSGKGASGPDKNVFIATTTAELVNKWRMPDTKTEVAGAKPPVPSIDIRSPADRDKTERMANLVEMQILQGAYSPGVTTFLRENQLFKPEDINAFVSKYHTKKKTPTTK